MQSIQNLWYDITKDESLIEATFSNIRNKTETLYSQVKLKPVLIKEELHYHFE